ncbi:TRAP transporter substrate-binding protein [Desulfobacula sp.]|uniref:TRAP transporter substrate-binding protein n=1 Tax=Desulfobacula sp. TaxID=2593537 RepID=UPI002601E64A|nr:TRAP transporter substrate-binding protein [Desulfobacula sp.]
MENFINKKTMFLCLLITIVTFAFIGLKLTDVAAASENKPVILKMSTYLTPSYKDGFYANKRMVDYINLHGKKCNLSAEFFHSGTVYKAKELLPSCMTGSLDIGGLVAPYVEGSIPALGVSSLPFAWESFYVHRDGTRRGSPYFNFLADEYAQRGLVLLSQSPVGPQEFISSKPLLKLEDWKGLKVRVSGAVYSKAMQTIGAVPISMPSGEVYTSLQRGVVDAAQGLDITFKARKLYEVTKHQINFSCFDMEWTIFMNKKKFDSLSKDQQKVVMNAAEICGHDMSTSEVLGGFMGLRSSLEKKNGINQIYYSENEYKRFKKAMEPVVEWWTKKVGKETAQKALRAVRDSQDVGIPSWGKLDLILPE